MPIAINLEGLKFGRLLVLAPTRKGRYRAWICLCDCGKNHVVMTGALKGDSTKSCGCIRSERGKKRLTRHGHTANGVITPTYEAWSHALKRCNNPDHPSYPRYGGRGIKVCERWYDFANFLADMGERPDARLSLDRIDNDGNYEPGNCRWATRWQQCRNKSNNRVLTVNGLTKPMAYWCDLSGINSNVMRSRLRNGWSHEDTVLIPPEPRRPRSLEQKPSCQSSSSKGR